MTWLTGYSYRKKITITGQTGAGTNYTVKLQIGNSSGGNFNLSGHALSFPNDIRFTNSDSSIQLDYWIEDVTANPINVWVEVADSLSSNVDIYCYYGKASDTTTSNGINTFQLFDDFSSGNYSPKWTVEEGSWSASTGELITQGSTYETIRTDISGYNREIIVKTKTIIGGGRGQNWFYFSLYNTLGTYSTTSYPSNSRGYDFIFYWDSAGWGTPQETYRIDNSVPTKLATSPNHTPDNNYHTVTIDIYNGSIKYYLDSTLMTSITDNTYNATNYSPNRFYIRHYETSGAGASYFDNIISRNYVYPEPTFSTSGSEELGVTAYSMSLHPSETPCRTGICTIRADVTWQNLGSSSITFRPTIIIDGTTYVQAVSDTTITGSYPATSSLIQITTPTLLAGTHSICPYPN